MKKLSWIFAIFFSVISISYANTEEGSNSESEPASAPAAVTPEKVVEAPNSNTLDPIVIPIIKAGKVYGYLRVEVQLTTKDESPIESIKPILPILRDKYFTNLYGLLCDRWLPDTPLNQDTILELVKKITTSVLLEKTKEDNIKVYFKSFYFTPANK